MRSKKIMMTLVSFRDAFILFHHPPATHPEPCRLETPPYCAVANRTGFVCLSRVMISCCSAVIRVFPLKFALNSRPVITNPTLLPSYARAVFKAKSYPTGDKLYLSLSSPSKSAAVAGRYVPSARAYTAPTSTFPSAANFPSAVFLPSSHVSSPSGLGG